MQILKQAIIVSCVAVTLACHAGSGSSSGNGTNTNGNTVINSAGELVDTTGKTVNSVKSMGQTTTGIANSAGQAVGNAESVGTINPTVTTDSVASPVGITGGTPPRQAGGPGTQTKR